MKAMIYKKILIQDSPYAIGVDYYAQKKVKMGLSQYGEQLTVFHPEMAKAVIRDLNILLEWYKTPYCQWAKRKAKQ